MEPEVISFDSALVLYSIKYITNIKIEAKLLFEGSRPLGRPRLRWLDDVCDDLKVLKVRNWKELAMGKKVLSDLCENEKAHKGL
jgi:hypothetical protein